jgi:hypothetical protein
MRWAATHLSVRLVSSEVAPVPGETRTDTMAQAWAQLSEACSGVRRAVPELPLGLHLVTATGMVWYAFRPDDTPDDVRAGIDALAEGGPGDADGGVYGWDRVAQRWVSL